MRAEAENAECLSELVRIIWSVIERHSPGGSAGSHKGFCAEISVGDVE